MAGPVPKTFSQQDLHFGVPFIVNEDIFVGVLKDEEVDHAKKKKLPNWEDCVF